MSGHAFLFPGQGSQAVGMGKALYEHSAAARDVFDQADEALGFSISKLCFEGPQDQLVLTANTQPAILTTSIAALAALREAVPDLKPHVAMGHSLGEFSALVCGGALRFVDAVRLVRLRGEAMQDAVPVSVGGMVAVLGASSDAVESLCAQASTPDELVAPANENGGGQIVVAGHVNALARLMELAKSTRSRCRQLDVSAPFHCAMMQPAADRLAAALMDIEVRPPNVPVISNVTAAPHTNPERVKALLVEQVTHRVRWEASVHRARQDGATSGLELGHGNVLAGLLRRIKPALPVKPVCSVTDIDVIKGEIYGG